MSSSQAQTSSSLSMSRTSSSSSTSNHQTVSRPTNPQHASSALPPSLMTRASHQSTDSTSTTASSQSSTTSSSHHSKLPRFLRKDKKATKTGGGESAVVVQGTCPRESHDGGGRAAMQNGGRPVSAGEFTTTSTAFNPSHFSPSLESDAFDFQPSSASSSTSIPSPHPRPSLSTTSSTESTKPAKKMSRSRTLVRKISNSRLFSHPESSSSSRSTSSRQQRPDSTCLTSSPREACEDDDPDSLLDSSDPLDADPMIIVDPPPPSFPSSSSHPPRTQRVTSSPTTSSASIFQNDERDLREASSPSRPLSTVNYTMTPPTAPNGDSPYHHSNGSSNRLGEIASAIPTRLGGWFSNLLPTNAASESSSPSAASTSPAYQLPSSLQPSLASSSYPIPPSLHASQSLNQSKPSPSSVQSPPKAQRSVLTAVREKGAIMRYLLDPDASRPEKCEEGIWVMGQLHDGWRPPGGSGGERRGSDVERPNSNINASPQKRVSKGSAGAGGLVPASPNKFTNIFSTSTLSLSLGARDSDDASGRKVKEDVRWPEDFFLDFQSTIWCTYRSQYAPIIHLPPHLLVPSPSSYDDDGLPLFSFVEASRESNANQPVIPRSQSGWSWVRSGTSDDKGLTADSGWGCMLRTGQSLLANSLVHLHLGRDWRKPLVAPDLSTSSEKERIEYATYVKIISWFLDDPLPYAPFSVHRMALVGKQLGKEIGEWFGPSTAAGAIKTLANAFPHAGLSVSLASDSVIFRSDVFDASHLVSDASLAAQIGKKSSGKEKEKTWGGNAVLVLVGVRLGLDGVNPIYHESVKNLFTFPQSVGIAGGRPSSSYYFLGYQADSLFYLDPHHTRPAVVLRVPPSRADLESSLEEETDSSAHSTDQEPEEDTSDMPQLATSNPSTSTPPSAPTDLPIPHPTHPTRSELPSSQPGSATTSLDPLQQWYATAYSPQALQTFHCDKVRRMAFNQLDPSMLLGFLCKDEADWNDFRTRVANMPNAIFSIVDEPSSWDDTDDAGLESFSETDPDDDDLASTSIASTTLDHREEEAVKDEEDECDVSLTASTVDGDLPTPLREATRRPVQPRPRRRESVLSLDEDDDGLGEGEDSGGVLASPMEVVEKEALGLPAPSPSTNPDSASLPRRQPAPSPDSPSRPPQTVGAGGRPRPARALGSEFCIVDESDWKESPADRPTPPIHRFSATSTVSSSSSSSTSASSIPATDLRPSTPPALQLPSSSSQTPPRPPFSSSSMSSSPPTPSRRRSTTQGGDSSRHRHHRHHSPAPLSSSAASYSPAEQRDEEAQKVDFPCKKGDDEEVDDSVDEGWEERLGPRSGWAAAGSASGGRKGGSRNFSGATLKRLEDGDDDQEDDF